MVFELQGFRLMAAEGTYKAYFRGNGANVIKNVPETALKLTCNDRVKAMVAADGHTVMLSRENYPVVLAAIAEVAWCCMDDSMKLATCTGFVQLGSSHHLSCTRKVYAYNHSMLGDVLKQWCYR